MEIGWPFKVITMKTFQFILPLYLLFFFENSQAQVGIGTTNPSSSSQLDVSSTNKGFLPPRMSLADRNNISAPIEGLVIWCNDCGVYGEMQVFNGVIWTNITGEQTAGVPVIGDNGGGGVVAYILQSGDPGYISGETHGLIAAPSDQSISSSWGCIGIIIGGTSTSLGSGQANTTAIVNGCLNQSIAANICNTFVLNNYTDWYLPSKDELNILYLNQIAIGGFAADFYWSSSEDSNVTAWGQHFNSGAQNGFGKSNLYHVRAIRSF